MEDTITDQLRQIDPHCPIPKKPGPSELDFTKLPVKLFAKLILVQKEVERIHKKGKNEFANYTYMKEEDLIEGVRDAMTKHGIICVPHYISEVTELMAQKTRNQGDQWETNIVIDWVWIDVGDGTDADQGSGQYYVNRVPSCARDTGDKGAYKAWTGSRKYNLVEMLMVSREDDPEAPAQDDFPPSRGYQQQQPRYPQNQNRSANPPPPVHRPPPPKPPAPLASTQLPPGTPSNVTAMPPPEALTPKQQEIAQRSKEAQQAVQAPVSEQAPIQKLADPKKAAKKGDEVLITDLILMAKYSDVDKTYRAKIAGKNIWCNDFDLGTALIAANGQQRVAVCRPSARIKDQYKLIALEPLPTMDANDPALKHETDDIQI